MLTDDYEEFTESQLAILKRYVTNVSGHVFVLLNLPEVIKGALFSRYSRSLRYLRTLLLEEFITADEETAFASIVGRNSGLEEESPAHDQLHAIKKAQAFYDRILDGYGDDSIGELGGAHLAVENISMLAAKVIEDSRIGGSPLEKSTRYIYFDQKVKGEYLFYREPVLMTSAYRDAYIESCNHLFDAYRRLIPPLTARLEEQFPRETTMSPHAYAAALRAKVLDCLRGLLPASTLTNMGLYGNGRFFEQLLHKLQCHPLAELQEVGKRSYEELSKVIPSFVRRAAAAHRSHESYLQFHETLQSDLRVVAAEYATEKVVSEETGVKLIASDPEAVIKVAACLLFAASGQDLPALQAKCRSLPDEEIARILDAGSNARENRRHKSPRALEQANFTFEIVADFGAYRDLQRHRLLTQERQLLTCSLGYYVPAEIEGTPYEEEYRSALGRAKEVYDLIASELPEEAQYAVPMAYRIRWYMHVNLRALQWLCELRSSPAGHPSYRHIAQAMAQQVCALFPPFERFFKFVDYQGEALGRLAQEERKLKKQQALMPL